MKHGCHNKPDRAPAYQVLDGRNPDGTPKFKWVTDQMTPGCGYDLRPTDPACDGCRHRYGGE